MYLCDYLMDEVEEDSKIFNLYDNKFSSKIMNFVLPGSESTDKFIEMIEGGM